MFALFRSLLSHSLSPSSALRWLVLYDLKHLETIQLKSQLATLQLRGGAAPSILLPVCLGALRASESQQWTKTGERKRGGGCRIVYPPPPPPPRGSPHLQIKPKIYPRATDPIHFQIINCFYNLYFLNKKTIVFSFFGCTNSNNIVQIT